MAKTMKPLVLFAIICVMCCSLTAAIMFNIEPNTQKCLRDEMQAHQLVVGEYETSDAPGQKLDYVVRGPINSLAVDIQCLLIEFVYRFETPRATSYRKRRTLAKGNSVLHQSFSRTLKCVSFHECHKVSVSYDFLPIGSWLNILFEHSDQRGIAHEVSLNLKKGVDTKSYEGVSIIPVTQLSTYTICNVKPKNFSF